MTVILVILLGLLTFVAVEMYVRLHDANRSIGWLRHDRDYWQRREREAVTAIVQRNESVKTRGRMISELELRVNALTGELRHLENKYRKNANCDKQHRSVSEKKIETAMLAFCRQKSLSPELFEVYPCDICLPEGGQAIYHFGHRSKADKLRRMGNRIEVPNAIVNEIREADRRP